MLRYITDRYRDLMREWRIDRLLHQMFEENDYKKRREIRDEFIREIKSRSPGQVARMEKRMGLYEGEL